MNFRVSLLSFRSAIQTGVGVYAPIPAHKAARFGSQSKAFTIADADTLNPALLEAFARQFPMGKQVMFNHLGSWDASRVIAHEPGDMILSHPMYEKFIRIRGLEENEDVWRSLLREHLPVLNGMMSFEQCRSQITQVGSFSSLGNRLFTRDDVKTLNSKLVDAFFRRFSKPNAQLLWATRPDKPVTIWDVLESDSSGKLKIKDQRTKQVLELKNLRDGLANPSTEFTYQVEKHHPRFKFPDQGEPPNKLPSSDLRSLLGLNLQLVSHTQVTAEEQWRELFEGLMERKIYRRPADEIPKAWRNITPEEVKDNKWRVYSPVGFTRDGHLVVFQRPDWKMDNHPELDPELKPVSGSNFADDARVQKVFLKKFPNGATQLSKEIVYPEDLYPIAGDEGFYENGAFVVEKLDDRGRPQLIKDTG